MAQLNPIHRNLTPGQSSYEAGDAVCNPFALTWAGIGGATVGELRHVVIHGDAATGAPRFRLHLFSSPVDAADGVVCDFSAEEIATRQALLNFGELGQDPLMVDATHLSADYAPRSERMPARLTSDHRTVYCVIETVDAFEFGVDPRFYVEAIIAPHGNA